MTRVQFTPDLMPGDVTGSLVYDARTAEFEFRQGPVFTNLLLADEINRTPPKTQASLLEAMEERQVTVDGKPRPLPDPFVVIATQNPIEYEGTYPLPEAQLDRFLLKLTVPLPGRDDEIAVLDKASRRFRPAQPGRGRRHRGGRQGRARGRAGRRPPGLRAPGGARLHRRRLPGDPQLAVAVARRLAARRDGDAQHRQGVGLAVRPRLRDAGRRQGAGPADAAAPDRAAARGPDRGRDRRRRARRRAGHRARCPADVTLCPSPAAPRWSPRSSWRSPSAGRPAAPPWSG